MRSFSPSSRKSPSAPWELMIPVRQFQSPRDNSPRTGAALAPPQPLSCGRKDGRTDVATTSFRHISMGDPLVFTLSEVNSILSGVWHKRGTDRPDPERDDETRDGILKSKPRAIKPIARYWLCLFPLSLLLLFSLPSGNIATIIYTRNTRAVRANFSVQADFVTTTTTTKPLSWAWPPHPRQYRQIWPIAICTSPLLFHPAPDLSL